MKPKLYILIPLTVVLLSVFTAGIYFAVAKAGFISDVKTEELQTVEVREYEGKNLSSVNDFRENSIKGPQYVDIATYQLEVTGLSWKSR